MNFSKRETLVLRFATIFAITFLIVFLSITLTQSAYSTPISFSSTINGMEIIVGPPPNSTNIPLDTTIIVDAFASASLEDLRMTPEVKFSNIYSETTGPLTYKTTFCPAKPLEPSTGYTISVTIIQTPLTWSFTTTNEPFEPQMHHFFANNGLLIALLLATTTTIILGLITWFRRKKE